MGPEAVFCGGCSSDSTAAAQRRTADLVLLDGNPLEDIANVRPHSCRRVRRGRFLD